MAKRAICDQCGAAADLTATYETIPEGWYTLRLPNRIASKDCCSLDCLEAAVRAERATDLDTTVTTLAETPLADRVDAGGVPT